MPANNASEPHAGRVALVSGTSRGIGQANGGNAFGL
jgi:hypothetical protein